MANHQGRIEKRRNAGRRAKASRVAGLWPIVEGLEERRLLAAPVAINEFGGSAAINNTGGITTGPDGNLWFTELGTLNNPAGAIDRITPSGAIQRFTAGLSTAGVPTGITSGPDNALWFTEYGGVAFGFPIGASAIGRIDPTTGVISEFTTGLTANSGPSQITLGSDGALWFTENKVSQIGRIDPVTKQITEFSMGLTANSQPIGITAGPDRALWFAESNTDLIGRIDPITKQINEFGAGLITSNSVPTGITTGPDGALWFTENGKLSSTPPVAGAIGRITTQGSITQFSSGLIPNAGPAGIVSGPDGSLYFTDRNNGFVGQVTTQGAITEFTQNPPTSSPGAITLGPDSNLWFTELTGTQVDRITPAGVLSQFPAADALPSNSTPTGITAGPDGALWFTEPGSNAIGRIDTSGHLTQFPTGIPGTPDRITQGTDGNLYFTEAISQGTALVKITPQGVVSTNITVSPATAAYITPGPNDAGSQISFLITNGQAISLAEQPNANVSTTTFPNPTGALARGVTVGPDGNYWFTVDRSGGTGTSSVDRVTLVPNGQGSFMFGVFTEFPIPPTNGVDAGPTDITSGADGNLYFTEASTGKLARITTSGVITELTGAFSNPNGVVLGPDNLIYFADTGGNDIVRLNADGSFTRIAIPTASSSPITLAVGPDKNLYFTESFIGATTPNAQIGQVILPQSSVTASGVPTLNLTAGQPFNQVLTTFADASPAASAANFAATVDYGDGTQPAPGVITPLSTGGFSIGGSHTYAAGGQYTIVVTISNQAGQAAPVRLIANVAQPVVGNFVVTNTNDTGPGSLRQAIQGANASSISTITFQIPPPPGGANTGVFTITPLSPLPQIVKPTVIDGTSEATSVGRPATTVLVQVDGRQASGAPGLRFGTGSSGSVLKGLSIFGFAGAQVELDSSNDRVSGSYLGFSSQSVSAAVSGMAPTVGSEGLLVTGANAVIGGLVAADRNVISGNADHGILFAGPTALNGLVLGNFIGTNPLGNAPLPNLGHGIVAIGGAQGLVIRQNLISGNDGNGVELVGSAGNVISSNLIGTDSLGGDPVPNLGSGVCLDNGSTGNTVGGLVSDGSTNIISANKVAGIAIQSGSSGNLILGNRIGTNCVGNFARGNGAAGILVSASSNNIFKFNLISGNGGNGLELFASTANLVSSNLIGTDFQGGDPVPNLGSGVCVDVGSTGNTIGGLVSEGATNIISANGVTGVAIQGGSSDNRVLGNRIGTNCVGNFARGNGNAGILISNSSGNLIGPDNLVSGNGTAQAGAGIWIDGALSLGNRVFGNKVGTSLDGETAIPNAIVGVLINEGSGNVIGGPLPADCNLVSGNGAVGVEIAGTLAAFNAVQSNVIGLDTAGGKALGNGGPNAGAGVYILNASHNFIGGSTIAVGNLISGNTFDGLEVFGAPATDNLIQSNRIGINGPGNGTIGNKNDGLVLDATTGNRILMNFIAGNGRNGIFVANSSNNDIQLNSIGVGLFGEPFGNGGYGILVGNGSTSPLDAGNNVDLNNIRGPYRNTAVVPSVSPTVIVTQGGKVIKTSQATVKIQPKAQSFGTRPAPSLASRSAVKSRA